MGHSPMAVRTRLHRFGLQAVCMCTLLFSLAIVSTAQAGSHYYCSSCTIYAYSSYMDPTAHYIKLDYVHRLSGPGSGVTIGARAKYVSDGSWGSYVYSTSTSVQHGYNGTRNAWGAATNFGGGNYGFNAHVNY